jgi:predicted DNA-binding transcriptional regulator AlpA
VTNLLDRLLTNLPPEAVLSDKQVCALAGISRDTLWRLERAGDAPARIQLSARRHGRQLSEVRRWLAARTATPDNAAA